MLRRLIIVIATVSALGISLCPTDAVADSVPNWDVTASCRGAASAGYSQDTNVTIQQCLESEQRTRDTLDKNWSTFPAADRINCVKAQTFEPTYTELATCLEMKRDLRNPAGTTPQR